MEILLPDWVEIAVNSFSPFFCLSNLDSDIRVAGTRLILCLQALGTNNCGTARHGMAWHSTAHIAERTERERSQCSSPTETPATGTLCSPSEP